MEDLKEQKSYRLNQYSIFHFFRNVCSPILAELLAKELKNCEYIKEQLNKNEHDTLGKTFYKALKSVSSRGKTLAARKKKHVAEDGEGPTKTQHLNNLEDNEALLSQMKICDIVCESDGGEKSMVVRKLGELNVTFLLNILTNDVLKFPLSDIGKHLNTLKNCRNSILHKDDDNKMDRLQMINEAVESVYRYLGKDIAILQEKIKMYFSSSLNDYPSVMEDAQQEIHKTYCHSVPHLQYNMQPTIQHIRDSESYVVVESFVEFLKKLKASVWQPILVCGAPGSGKSSILYSLVHAFIHSEDFLLVVWLPQNNTEMMSKQNFWQCVYRHLTNLCPHTVQKYGEEQVMMALENYSSKFLFLWDLNLKDSRKQPVFIDQGTWIMTYQGLPENSTNSCVLKVASLSEEQVCQVLCSFNMSRDHYNKVHEMYRKCEYKGLINTPAMVHIFASVCVGNTGSLPFYKLIQLYIDSKIDWTEENQVEMIKLGQKAFNAIKENRKYYSELCLADIESNIKDPFLEYSPSKGYFFQYQVVEDCLAAWYIVAHPETACAVWLQQTPLFKRVFEVVCALWCKREEGIQHNIHFLRQYLETFFEISKPPRNKVKKQKCNELGHVDKGEGKNRRVRKEEHHQVMDVDENENEENIQNTYEMNIGENDHKCKTLKPIGGKCVNKTKKKRPVIELEDHNTKPNNFLRWIFVSKIARANQNIQDILLLLADLLACKNVWVFKCKLLNDNVIDNLSLVLRHVNMNKNLTIKVESGPNVSVLLNLWSMLCSHPGVYHNADMQLVIHHTENNWVGQERQLAELPSVIARTRACLHITKYIGPLLCSRVPHFMKCSCMAGLQVLDVHVCDLFSLREVLACQQDSLVSVIVTLKLKAEEQEQITSNTMKIPLSPTLPLTLKVIYFEKLQRVLDMFEQPDLLTSLTIYKVYIHENFKLDLTHFTKMESLFIRFIYMGKLPSFTLSENKMDVNDEDDTKIPLLPLEYWTFQFVINLHLPANLQRFLMRNLSFCGDSNMHLLCKYWEDMALQRLTLLDSDISLSKVQNFLTTKVEDDIGNAMKRCRIDELQASARSIVKKERLKKEEREQRRQQKPEGNELIITSETKLCHECHLLSCACHTPDIHQCMNTYEGFVSLVEQVYLYEILNISYSGNGVVIRKDMCGDMQVECPLPFLNDERAEYPEGQPELYKVLKVLTLAQLICLSYTQLSHQGAVHLINHLKEKKKLSGSTEPFRLTILSRYYHTCALSIEEVKHCHFTRLIKNDESLQQFNFKCNCRMKCHHFKKTIEGDIYFNDTKLLSRER